MLRRFYEKVTSVTQDIRMTGVESNAHRAPQMKRAGTRNICFAFYLFVFLTWSYGCKDKRMKKKEPVLLFYVVYSLP